MSPRRSKLSSVDSAGAALHVALDHLDELFQRCRSEQHRWSVVEDFRLVSTDEIDIRARAGHSRYVRRVKQCDTCGTRRVEAYALTKLYGYSALQSIGATYDYPDGYTLHGLPPGLRGVAELVRGLQFDRQLEAEQAEPARKRTKTSRSSA